MWVSFKPVKRKDILQRVARGLPGRADVRWTEAGWMLLLKVTTTRKDVKK